MNRNATLEKLIFLGVMLVLAFLSSNLAWRPDRGGAQEAAITPAAQMADIQSSALSQPEPASSEQLSAETLPQGAGIFHRTGGDGSPEINAAAGLVADLQTGEIYFAKNLNHRWPIASISKLATAVLASDKLDLAMKITLTPQNFTTEGGDLTAELKAGETFSARDLLRAMLIFSSNEAAEALASAYGRDKFLSDMNSLARSWELKNTHFSDPTGLSAANQSTPLDLLLLAQRTYKDYPQLYAITRNKQMILTELNSGRQEVVNNINLFAGRPDFLGGKTGYTDEAGGNLLSIFAYDNRPVAVIVLGAEDRFGEAEKLINWFRQNYST